MSTRDETCAVIIDGGPAGLAAAWAAITAPGSGGGSGGSSAAGVGRPVLIICTPPGPIGVGRRRAVAKLTALCNTPHTIELRPPATIPSFLANEPPLDAPSRRVLTHLLIDAGAEAIALDVARLIWPVHSGAASDAELRTETVADACDRSLLVGQLASLDAPRTGAGSRGVRLETPYADLTDRQIAEILIDLGAPLAACWWCETAAERPCAACPPCVRWSIALKRAGARAPLTL